MGFSPSVGCADSSPIRWSQGMVVAILPSSDEEGVGVADTYLPNPGGLLVLRNEFSPSVIATRCQLPHQVEPGNDQPLPCLPLMRKVAARLVAMTEGEITYLPNSADLPVLRQGFFLRRRIPTSFPSAYLP